LNSRTGTDGPAFSLPQLLAHALAIELEAVQSYQDLALQMEHCGNPAVAALFEKMALLEAEHVAQIRDKVGADNLPELAPWEYRWSGLESPENIDHSAIHYLMTPHHALKLALDNELNAQAFFAAAAKDCTDDGVRTLALEFANDERQHVAWMKDWLAKYPPPDDDWDADPDPPVAID